MKHIDNDIWLWVTVRLHRMLDQVRFECDKNRCRAEFPDLEKCLLFIGYPRSGHSFVGSILDAHPEVLIAHRLDAAALLSKAIDFSRLAYLIKKNSERFAQNNRRLTGYEYPVNTGWQGTYRRLLVVGDQEGKRTSLCLGKDPALVEELLAAKRPQVYFLHVTRNPFDNISTWSMRTHRSLETMIEKYFTLCEHTQKIIACVDGQRVLTFKHEDIIRHFDSTVSGILAFLGLTEPEGYLEACRSTVYTKPNCSRYKVSWPDELIEKVEKRLERFEFLRSYRYDK